MVFLNHNNEIAKLPQVCSDIWTYVISFGFLNIEVYIWIVFISFNIIGVLESFFNELFIILKMPAVFFFCGMVPSFLSQLHIFQAFGFQPEEGPLREIETHNLLGLF